MLQFEKTENWLHLADEIQDFLATHMADAIEQSRSKHGYLTITEAAKAIVNCNLDENFELWRCIQDGQTVAIVLLSQPYHLGAYRLLTSMVVHKYKRGQGIGSALLQRLLSEEKHLVTYIFSTDEKDPKAKEIEEFYKKNGAKPISKEEYNSFRYIDYLFNDPDCKAWKMR
jgi:predicted N-acetyltransferase YhbS